MAGPDELIGSVATTRPFYWITSEPWLTFDSNSAAWWTATNVVGKIFDVIGSRYFDATPTQRVFGLLTMVGTESFLGYFSHEFAHLQSYYNMGGQKRPRFEIEGVAGLLPKPIVGDQHLWCETERCMHLKSLTSTTGGINQQEFNAQFLSTSAIHSEILQPDLAVSYFLNRSYQSFYTIITVKDNDSQTFDPVVYRHELALSFEEQLAWSLGAMVFSGRTLDSIFAVGSYLANGKRDYRPIHFDINGTQIYPPDFHIFWHPDGLLLSTELPLRHVWRTSDDLVLNFAMGVAGGLHTFRIGGTYEPIPIHSHPAVPTVSIGQYLSINPDTPEILGSLTQCELHWLLPNNIGIDIKWQVSFQDPIETDIKGTGNMGQRIGIPIDFWRSGHAFRGGNNTLTLSGFIATKFMY